MFPVSQEPELPRHLDEAENAKWKRYMLSVIAEVERMPKPLASDFLQQITDVVGNRLNTKGN